MPVCYSPQKQNDTYQLFFLKKEFCSFFVLLQEQLVSGRVFLAGIFEGWTPGGGGVGQVFLKCAGCVPPQFPAPTQNDPVVRRCANRQEGGEEEVSQAVIVTACHRLHCDLPIGSVRPHVEGYGLSHRHTSPSFSVVPHYSIGAHDALRALPRRF